MLIVWHHLVIYLPLYLIFWTSNTNINEIFSGYYIPVILKISGILTFYMFYLGNLDDFSLLQYKY